MPFLKSLEIERDLFGELEHVLEILVAVAFQFRKGHIRTPWSRRIPQSIATGTPLSSLRPVPGGTLSKG